MKVLTISFDDGTTLTPGTPLAQRLVQYGTVVERMDVVQSGRADETLALSPSVTVYKVTARSPFMRIARIALRASRLAVRNRYDILSTKDPYYVGLVAWTLARMHGIGFHLQIHGFEKLRGVRALLARFVVRHADGIRTVSERTRRLLIEVFGADGKRITVVPIQVDCEALLARAGRHPATPMAGRFTFVTVGRLVPVKEIALQIRALARVRTKHPEARLVVVGEGPLRDALEAEARRCEEAVHVVFPGAVPDITPYLRQADCFLLTSRQEGYGLAPVEAACLGLPVIMTDVGCAGEVIKDGVNGTIVPVGDEHRLARAMQQMIEQSTQREAYRRANAQLHERLLSREETLARYVRSWESARRARVSG